MRFKISLEVLSQVSGNVLPIGYQYELYRKFHELITLSQSHYESWLEANGLTTQIADEQAIYSVSNFYIPKLYVENDRLTIQVPRIQFWVSFLPEIGTREFLEDVLRDQIFAVGDEFSSVSFQITEIEDISPVFYNDSMDYQSLSPIVIQGVRENGTKEFLPPSNPCFADFMYQDLVERWERYYQRPFNGIRGYNFYLLAPERRKSMSILVDSPVPVKLIGYMIKFRIEMDPMLQEFAYVCGLGDQLKLGFGYIELLKKRK